VFRGADPAGYVLLRAFRGDSTQPWRYLAWSGIRVGEGLAGVIDAAAGLAEAAAESGENIVFCPPMATFRDAAGAGVTNLCEGLVICVDCDKGRRREGLRRLEALLGPATLVVASGGITDDGEDKLRLYWRLQVPTRTAEEHALLNTAGQLAARPADADATSGPPNHPIRWAGSWHLKREPRLTRIVEQSENEVDLAWVSALRRGETGTKDDAEYHRGIGEAGPPTARIANRDEARGTSRGGWGRSVFSIGGAPVAASGEDPA